MTVEEELGFTPDRGSYDACTKTNLLLMLLADKIAPEHYEILKLLDHQLARAALAASGAEVGEVGLRHAEMHTRYMRLAMAI
jgi:hypothetical protein